MSWEWEDALANSMPRALGAGEKVSKYMWVIRKTKAYIWLGKAYSILPGHSMGVGRNETKR